MHFGSAMVVRQAASGFRDVTRRRPIRQGRPQAARLTERPAPPRTQLVLFVRPVILSLHRSRLSPPEGGMLPMHEDLLSLTPRATRREFVVTSLAAGFAAAVLPVSAETIKTDTEGLTAGEVKIPVKYDDKESEMPAYQAMPDKGGPFPVVLVVQEIFGVHEHIKDVCRRLAKVGYLAVAPELFFRQGDVSKETDIPKIIDKVVS